MLLGESVGETVGYRMRLDTKIGPTTKIEVVTEGILTRILQHDPSLNDYGLVIFDEFHERSLQADLGLVLTLTTQVYSLTFASSRTSSTSVIAMALTGTAGIGATMN